MNENFDVRASLGKAFNVADKVFNTAVSKAHSFFEDKDLPTVKINETEENYTLELAVPGYSQGSVSTAVDGDVLIVSAKAEKSKLEFYGDRDFERKFVLPRGAKTADVEALYVNGVLKVVVPVGEPPQVKIAVK